MAEYWWDKLKKNKKQQGILPTEGMSSFETLSPPEQLKHDRAMDMRSSQKSNIEYTGAGEDGIVQPSNPTEMVMTIDGPRMIHEGEAKVTLPGNRVTIVPQRVLKKMERELNIPGYQEGVGEVPIYDEGAGAEGGDSGSIAAADEAITADKPTYDYVPGKTDEWYNADIEGSDIVRYTSLGRPVYGLGPQAETRVAKAEPVVGPTPTAPVFTHIQETLEPPVATQASKMPMGAERGYQQIVDMMSPESDYWKNIRSTAENQVYATQAYDRAQLEQAIARGELSGSAANAARGRLARAHEGQIASMNVKMAADQATQQATLSQAAVNLGISMEDAKARWADLNLQYTKDIIDLAGKLFADDWSIDEINKQLRTKFTEDQLKLVAEDKKVARETARLLFESSKIKHGEQIYNTAVSLFADWGPDSIDRINDYLGLEGNDRFTPEELRAGADTILMSRQSAKAKHGQAMLDMCIEAFKNGTSVVDFNAEYGTTFEPDEIENAAWSPPQSISEYISQALTSQTSYADLASDEGFRRSIAEKYNIRDWESNEVDKYIEREYSAYIKGAEQMNASTNNLSTSIFTRYVGPYNRSDDGLAAALKDDYIIRLAKLSLGYAPDEEVDWDIIENQIRNMWKSHTDTAVDIALEELANEDTYAHYFDTPYARETIRKVFADSMYKTIVKDEATGKWTITGDFVFPWDDPDTFYDYNDFFGNNIQYNWADRPDGPGRFIESIQINGGDPMTWEQYRGQTVNLSDYGLDADKYGGTGDGGAITVGDLEKKWNREQNKEKYYTDGKFDMVSFIKDNFGPPDRKSGDIANMMTTSWWNNNFVAGSEDDYYIEIKDHLWNTTDNGGLNLSDPANFVHNVAGGFYAKDPNTGKYYKNSDPNFNSPGHLQIMDKDGNYSQLLISSNQPMFSKIYAQMSSMFNNGEPMDMQEFFDYWGDGSRYAVDRNGVILNFQKPENGGLWNLVSGNQNFTLSTSVGQRMTQDGLTDPPQVVTPNADGEITIEDKTDNEISYLSYDGEPIASDTDTFAWASTTELMSPAGKTGIEYQIVYPHHVYDQHKIDEDTDWVKNYTIKQSVKDKCPPGTVFTEGGKAYVILDRPTVQHKVWMNRGHTNFFFIEAFQVADRDGKVFQYIPYGKIFESRIQSAGLTTTWDKVSTFSSPIVTPTTEEPIGVNPVGRQI